MDAKEDQRLDFIDLTKGIGIFLIVWGHCMIVKSAYLYSFHLPLFFLISGYLYKKAPFPYFLVNKINRILIPFIFFFIVSWIIFLILIIVGYDPGSLIQHVKIFPFVFVGIEKDGGNGPIWFLACLFSLVLMYSLLDNYIKNQYLFNIVIVVLAMAGYLCAKWNIHLPYRTDIAFSCILFYHLGYYGRKYNFPGILNYNKGIKWLTILILVLLHILSYRMNLRLSGIHNVNIIANITGNIYLFYVSAFFGIAYSLIIASEIQKIRFINYLGQNSLIILAVHVLILHFIYDPIHQIFNHYVGLSLAFSFTVAVISVIICLPLIIFSKKYIPGFTGYKSLFSLANTNRMVKAKAE
jgi:acyltransferase